MEEKAYGRKEACRLNQDSRDLPLSEMTTEQLWELFPIVLTEHQGCWADWYEQERRALTALISDDNIKIHHIGSTSIGSIWAKPIIDILVELPERALMESVKEKLTGGGYLCMSEEGNRTSFNKGYTGKGFAERVFHIHLRCAGDHPELYFRDYMNDHPALAEEYVRLKLSLWKKYEHDRDAYTDAKGEFVEKYTACAKAEYKSRYEHENGRLP